MDKKFTKSEWSRKSPLYLEKSDARFKFHLKQLKSNGFSDSETWALDSVICKFILPRLIRFKKIAGGYPMGLTSKEWDEILDKIIFAFYFSNNCDEGEFNNCDEETKSLNWVRYEEGMQLFAKWFRNLLVI